VTKAGDLDDMMRMMMFQLLMKQKRGESDEGLDSGGRAFRRIRQMKARVSKEPNRIVNEYLEEIMEKLGVEDGDAWQLWNWSERVVWGKMLGLKRVHWHVSHILSLSLKDKRREAQAYMVQLLRGLHQVTLDGGSWEVASLLLPNRDPCARDHFGATERELEAVVAYQKAMKEIRRPAWNPTLSEEGGGKASSSGKGGGGAKGEQAKGGKGKGVKPPAAEPADGQ
jgi:hypothetical protein